MHSIHLPAILRYHNPVRMSPATWRIWVFLFWFPDALHGTRYREGRPRMVVSCTPRKERFGICRPMLPGDRGSRPTLRNGRMVSWTCPLLRHDQGQRAGRDESDAQVA